MMNFIRKEIVEETVLAARAYYALPGNICGGNLHIVLDDDNVEDGHLMFCLKECVNNSDGYGVMLCGTMLRMTEAERMAVVGRYEEYRVPFYG